MLPRRLWRHCGGDAGAGSSLARRHREVFLSRGHRASDGRPTQSGGGWRLLPAVPGRRLALCRGARRVARGPCIACRGALVARGTGRRALRLLCLCHLRPQQPGHAARVAVAPDPRRYRLGHSAHGRGSRGGPLGAGAHGMCRPWSFEPRGCTPQTAARHSGASRSSIWRPAHFSPSRVSAASQPPPATSPARAGYDELGSRPP